MQRGEPAGLVAERVEERVHDEVAVAGAQPDDVAPRLRTRAASAPWVAIDALRVAGGARREEDVGEVVGDRRAATRRSISASAAGRRPRGTSSQTRRHRSCAG